MVAVYPGSLLTTWAGFSRESGTQLLLDFNAGAPFKNPNPVLVDGGRAALQAPCRSLKCSKSLQRIARLRRSLGAGGWGGKQQLPVALPLPDQHKK